MQIKIVYFFANLLSFVDSFVEITCTLDLKQKEVKERYNSKLLLEVKI